MLTGGNIPAMNYTRILVAAVVATVVDAVYGFIVYGNLLAPQFAAQPGVYRPPAAQATYMPILFGGIFIAMLAASFIYAKGYEGGRGAAEGLRFGIVVGLLATAYSAMVSYAILNIGSRLGAAMMWSSLVEWIIAGVVIGLAYKPAPAGARQRAAV
jgi:hypothetical protein